MRTRRSIINHIKELRNKGYDIDKTLFNTYVERTCFIKGVNISPITLEVRDYFPHPSALTYREWEQLEHIYTRCLYDIKLFKGVM